MRQIRVKVFQPEGGNVKIVLSDPGDPQNVSPLKLPDKGLVRNEMPAKYRSLVKAYDWSSTRLEALVHQTVTQGLIPGQIWAESIGAALIKSEMARDPAGYVASFAGDPDLALMLTAGVPGLLMIGPYTFKLVPSEIHDQTKAFKVMRERMRTGAAAEGKQIIEASRQQAAMTVSSGQRLLEKIRRKTIHMQSTSSLLLPEWLESPVKKRSDEGSYPFDVGITLEFSPECYTYSDGKKIKNFKAKEAPLLRVRCWIPANLTTGQYAVGSTYVDQDCPELPHSSWVSSCVQAEGLPKLLKSQGDIFEVEEILTRAFKIVNLNSLLVHYPSWSPEVRAFCPPALAEVLASGMRPDESLLNLTEGNVKGVDEEAAETWTV